MGYLPYISIFAALFGAVGVCGKDRVGGFLLAVNGCALWFLFTVYGGESPRSVFEWLSSQWQCDDFKYARLMPLVSGYAVFAKRKAIAAAQKSPSLVGAGIVTLSLAAHALAFRAGLPSVSAATVVGAAWGTCYAVWGRHVARLLLFPAGYALLCFTIHLFAYAVPSLRLFASTVVEWLFKGMGVEITRLGTTLQSTAGHGFAFDVADGCSGLHSLVALTAIAAPYVFLFSKRDAWRKWGLFLLAVPLAVFANLVRVLAMAALGVSMGMELAMALGHDAAGYFVFLFAVMLLIRAERMMDADWEARWGAFRKAWLSREPRRDAQG